MAKLERNIMCLEERNAILYCDFPDMSKITEEIKHQNSKRVFTGGVRINNAQYRTAAEDFEYRQKSLRRKLP
jgi:hypothetical protein